MQCFGLRYFRYNGNRPRRTQLNFFEKLWNQPRFIIEDEWYTNEKGDKSTLLSTLDPKEDERLAYWNNILDVQTTKTKDWLAENEFRLILQNVIFDFSESKDRALKYDFNSLSGIVFGIRTSVDDKAKIIEIIHVKCKENNRPKFKFYQAYYDSALNNVAYYELKLFENIETDRQGG